MPPATRTVFSICWKRIKPQKSFTRDRLKGIGFEEKQVRLSTGVRTIHLTLTNVVSRALTLTLFALLAIACTPGVEDVQPISRPLLLRSMAHGSPSLCLQPNRHSHRQGTAHPLARISRPWHQGSLSSEVMRTILLKMRMPIWRSMATRRQSGAQNSRRRNGIRYDWTRPTW